MKIWNFFDDKPARFCDRSYGGCGRSLADAIVLWDDRQFMKLFDLLNPFMERNVDLVRGLQGQPQLPAWPVLLTQLQALGAATAPLAYSVAGNLDDSLGNAWHRLRLADQKWDAMSDDIRRTQRQLDLMSVTRDWIVAYRMPP